jgi:hypothetical protein
MLKGMNVAGVEMSLNTAPAINNTSEASAATAAPTGYRVSIVPCALEVSARLATARELRDLVKVLRAAITILEDESEDDSDAPSLAKRLSQAAAASPENSQTKARAAK